MRDLKVDITARDRTGPAFDSAKARALSMQGVLDGMERHMRLLAAAAAGFAAGFVIEGIARFAGALQNAVKEAADLADQAAKIGLLVEDLQRLTFGFTQAGIEAGDVDSILEKWSKNIGDAWTKGGQLADVFSANNINLSDGKGHLRSSVDLMADYAELIKHAGSDQERLVLAQLAGGKSASALVLALADGKAGFLGIMSEADKAGGVIDEKLVKRAAELDDKFNAVSHTIGVKVREALIRAAGDADHLYEIITGFDPATATGTSLDQHLADIGKERLDIETQILKRKEEQASITGPMAQMEQREIQGTIDALKERDALLRSQEETILRRLFPVSHDQEHEIDRSLADRKQTIIPSGEETPDLDPWAKPGGGDLREVDRERLAVLQLTAELQDELRLVHATAQEKRAAVASRQAGAAATDEERRQIIQLNEALYQEELAQREAREATEWRRDLFRDFLGDLKDGDGGFWDRFEKAGENALSRLTDKWLDSTADWIFGTGSFGDGKSGGGFPGLSLLGSLFGGGGHASTSTGASPLAAATNDNYAPGAVIRQALTGGAYGNDLASNIRTLAGNIGANPRDVGAMMSFESGFKPNIWGGSGGNYYGLIQAGPAERAAYGITPGGSLPDQFGGIESFFKDRGFKPGMSGLDLYSTVNAGSPGHYNASDAANGGTWGTVADKWNHQMDDHFAKADALLASSTDRASQAIDKMANNALDVGGNLGGFGNTITDTAQSFAQNFDWSSLLPQNFKASPSGFADMLGIPGGSAAPAAGGGFLQSLFGGIGDLFGGLFGLFGFADGGWPASVPGRAKGVGGPRSDGNLAWFSDGEYIVNAGATARYGGVLEAINDNADPGEVMRTLARHAGHFADGGWPGGNHTETYRRMLERGTMSGGQDGGQGSFGRGDHGIVIHQNFSFAGASTANELRVHAQQMGHAAVAQVKAEFPGWQVDLQQDRALA